MNQVPLEHDWDTAPDRRFRKYWGSLDLSQRILVLDAHEESWSKGEPVPTDVFMELTTNQLNAEYLQQYFMEES